jgi:hypothetical protein
MASLRIRARPHPWRMVAIGVNMRRDYAVVRLGMFGEFATGQSYENVARRKRGWLMSAVRLILATFALIAFTWCVSVDRAYSAAPPVNQAAPTISGTAQQGNILAANHGKWSGEKPIHFSYRWSDGQTGPTDPLSASDVGQAVAVTVTASNSAGAASVTSQSVGPILPAPPVNTAPPAISGNVEQGEMLSLSEGTWSNDPTGYAYAWQRCDSAGANCSSIAGAASNTYALGEDEVGSTIRAVVTASNAGGQTAAATAPTTVVAAAGTLPPSAATTTSLVASPQNPVTNSTATLIATVTSANSVVAPSGTIAFDANGNPIDGCASEAIAPTGQSVTVVCRTSFASSILELQAIFTPSPGAVVTGSLSPPASLSVGPASSVISLDATSTVDVGISTTYSVNVAAAPTQPGPLEPTGSVEFLDGGQPISGCDRRSLTNGGATCTVTYRSGSTHRITAHYLGDANFIGATSLPTNVSAVPRPANSRGFLTSTMQWTFYYTPLYTEIRALAVNGVSAGSTIRVRCTGKGCPFASRLSLVTRSKRCQKTLTNDCANQLHVDLAPPFRTRRLAVGTKISVTIARSGWIGKVYTFTVQARHGPLIQIGCLQPNGIRPQTRC